MRVVEVELRRVQLPLVTPFRTANGVDTVRDALLLRARGDAGEEGWGECVAMSSPHYSPEFAEGAQLVTQAHLLPLLFAAGDVRSEDVSAHLAPVKGHPMAKAAVEMAVLDAELRAAGVSLAEHLGATRAKVECGVAVGIAPSIAALLDEVDRFVAEGYRRVKLKIQPGWDVEPVRAVRARHPGLALQVDANGAYRLEDAPHLARLDELDLLLVEQPLDEHDLAGHARLAARLATPVCLDESITSVATARDALDRGACSVVNLKAGRVGGYLEARRIHDLCVEREVPVWCGGMLETGLGRAANVALAALPGFTLPGDLSASTRWFSTDVTAPLVPVDGLLAVPTGPGIGVSPDPPALDRVTVSRRLVPAR